ncbi:YuzL family protein [Bacillaceae bacterium S4-13-58]
MPKRTKNPSQRAVSAASVKGLKNRGQNEEFGKEHLHQTTNMQYGAENTSKEDD